MLDTEELENDTLVQSINVEEEISLAKSAAKEYLKKENPEKVVDDATSKLDELFSF